MQARCGSGDRSYEAPRWRCADLAPGDLIFELHRQSLFPCLAITLRLDKADRVRPLTYSTNKILKAIILIEVILKNLPTVFAMEHKGKLPLLYFRVYSASS